MFGLHRRGRHSTAAALSVCLATLFAFSHGGQARAQAVADPEGQLARQFFAADDKCRGLLREGKLKEAEAACKASLQLAGRLGSDRELEKVGAYEAVGHALLGQKRYKEALDYYGRAREAAGARLDDTNAEVGRIYWHVGMAHHGLRDLAKAREFYSKAEKTYQAAYAEIDPEEVVEEGLEIKRSYLRALRQILELHASAAEQANAADEAGELRKKLKNLPDDNFRQKQ